MRTALVVLGMHRSGTSAITRVLNLLGAALPNDLLPAQPDNPTGFWEPSTIVAFNDKLLEAHGLGWDSLQGPTSAAFDAMLGGPAFDAATQIVQQALDPKQSLFVLKDPRISRLLPFWQAVLASQAVRVVPVLALRHPWEVAQSLQQRAPIGEETALLLWLAHLLDGEHHSRGLLRGWLSYTDLLVDWREATARLGAAVGSPWPSPASTTQAGIAEFLAAGVRHHVGPADFGEASALHALARDVYAGACVAARDGETAAWQAQCAWARQHLTVAAAACTLQERRMQQAADKADKESQARIAACHHLILNLQQQLATQHANGQRVVGALRNQLDATMRQLHATPRGKAPG